MYIQSEEKFTTKECKTAITQSVQKLKDNEKQDEKADMHHKHSGRLVNCCTT